jgi:hypothetical protein
VREIEIALLRIAVVTFEAVSVEEDAKIPGIGCRGNETKTKINELHG